jgi:hypothetical protein
VALLRCGVSTVPIQNWRQPVLREAPPSITHGEVTVHVAGIDYRERLAQQLNGTVFDELNALATRLAAEASRAECVTQSARLMAEADTVARLLARLRTMLFTLDPPEANPPIR